MLKKAVSFTVNTFSVIRTAVHSLFVCNDEPNHPVGRVSLIPVHEGYIFLYPSQGPRFSFYRLDLALPGPFSNVTDHISTL
jgi:hypothetical protein